jgi:hypothetical protein
MNTDWYNADAAYDRGYHSGIAHYERTQRGMGALKPTSGHRYDSPYDNAWQYGYAEGWSKAKNDAQNAPAVYATATAEF